MATSEQINQNNSEFVIETIRRKISNAPCFITDEQLGYVVTDMDHFPYQRFYRGAIGSYTRPALIEREAGFRPRRDSCYENIKTIEIHKPQYCWQYPCSSIESCKPAKTEGTTKPQCNVVMPP
jgi:hypothetical protein